MLRNKLSFLLASSLCLAFVGCDDGDGDDTGAGTESGTTDATTTDTPTTDTPTTDTPTTDTPTTDGETTDTPTTDTPDTDTSDDSSTTDDSGDPCDDVVCEDGQSCVGGICVDDGGDTEGETDSGGGEPDANYPNPADGCPKGTVDATANGISLCIPSCDASAADIASACVDPETGTSPGVCLLYPPGGSGAECTEDGFGTAAACEADGEFCTSIAAGSFTCETAGFCAIACPEGATCPDAMVCGAMGLCEYE